MLRPLVPQLDRMATTQRAWERAEEAMEESINENRRPPTPIVQLRSTCRMSLLLMSLLLMSLLLMRRLAMWHMHTTQSTPRVLEQVRKPGSMLEARVLSSAAESSQVSPHGVRSVNDR